MIHITFLICTYLQNNHNETAQGWVLLIQYPRFSYFPNFSASPKYMLAVEYHVHISKVSRQLSCGDICQIWMWCIWFNRYIGSIEHFAYGEINERGFSNPHLLTCPISVDLYPKTFHLYIHFRSKEDANETVQARLRVGTGFDYNWQIYSTHCCAQF